MIGKTAFEMKMATTIIRGLLKKLLKINIGESAIIRWSKETNVKRILFFMRPLAILTQCKFGCAWLICLAAKLSTGLVKKRLIAKRYTIVHTPENIIVAFRILEKKRIAT